MGRREGIYRRYIKAFDRFGKTKSDDTIAVLRNPSSLKELGKVEHTVIAQSVAGVESKHLMVVELQSRRKQSQFFLRGWARKAGFIKVPAEEIFP